MIFFIYAKKVLWNLHFFTYSCKDDLRPPSSLKWNPFVFLIVYLLLTSHKSRIDDIINTLNYSITIVMASKDSHTLSKAFRRSRRTPLGPPSSLEKNLHWLLSVWRFLARCKPRTLQQYQHCEVLYHHGDGLHRQWHPLQGLKEVQEAYRGPRWW